MRFANKKEKHIHKYRFYVTNTGLPGIHLWNSVQCIVDRLRAFVDRSLYICELLSVHLWINQFVDLWNTASIKMLTNPQMRGLHPPSSQANHITATFCWPIVARVERVHVCETLKADDTWSNFLSNVARQLWAMLHPMGNQVRHRADNRSKISR